MCAWLLIFCLSFYQLYGGELIGEETTEAHRSAIYANTPQELEKFVRFDGGTLPNGWVKIDDETAQMTVLNPSAPDSRVFCEVKYSARGVCEDKLTTFLKVEHFHNDVLQGHCLVKLCRKEQDDKTATIEVALLQWKDLDDLTVRNVVRHLLCMPRDSAFPTYVSVRDQIVGVRGPVEAMYSSRIEGTTIRVFCFLRCVDSGCVVEAGHVVWDGSFVPLRARIRNAFLDNCLVSFVRTHVFRRQR